MRAKRLIYRRLEPDDIYLVPTAKRLIFTGLTAKKIIYWVSTAKRHILGVDSQKTYI